MTAPLTPQEAAGELKISTETLRRWRRDNIGPPYVMHGGKPRYRSDLIHAGSYAVQGRQETFPKAVDEAEAIPETDFSSAPVHVIVGEVARWKETELYRRAERYFDGWEIEGEAYEEYKRERKIILPAEHPLCLLEEPVSEAVQAKATEIWGPGHHHMFEPLLLPAWREVIIAEDKWTLEGDLSSLPIRPPE